MPLSLTIDLEDPSAVYSPKGRYIVMTNRILAMCQELSVKATFFTVGRLAQAAPELIRKIVEQGHEIAYHSHGHVPLTQDSPARFKQECCDDKYLLEDLAGRVVRGFRAPCFSLTPSTLWATDVLAECGFLYSSSIMPTDISRFGFKDAPSTPFRWPSGLVEFPLPMAKVGCFKLPYSGGIYLYSWPVFIVDAFLGRAQVQDVIWTYTHPQDFDADEPFHSMPSTPDWMSLILWLRREVAEKRIRRLLARYEPGKPLGDIAQSLLTQTSLPVLGAK